MSNRPSPALVKLTAAIRRYRRRAELTQIRLAELVPCSDKTLSAIETGRERPSRGMVLAIEKALDLPPESLVDLYDLMDEESMPGWMRDWLVEERRAVMLRSFELAIIPGLLQIDDYARALLDGEETAVQARMDRQNILVGDEAPVLHVVLDEGVLYREVGSRQTMYDQLKHLTERVSERLTVQIVTSDVNPSRSGAFTIGSLDTGEVAYIETAIQGIVTSSRDDVDRLNKIWESIRSHALSQRESLDFIRRTADTRWT